MPSKHIYFCYANKNEFDSTIAADLKKRFDKRRFRVYYPRQNEDINMTIATGIENAAIVLVFPSQSLQTSKTASKLLNYADQTKTPLLNIKHREDFQGKGWLGTILASATSCSTDFNEILNNLTSLKINTNDLILERNENNQPQEMQRHLFYGGTEKGNVFASYKQAGQEFPMKLQFLGLDQGKVFGQGHDDVGDFTLAGKYRVENGSGKVKMHKQYIEKHSVEYRGEISFQDNYCIMKGKWEIGNNHDEFLIQLILPEIYKIEIERMPTPKFVRVQGNKVMLSYCPNQYDLSQKIMKGLINKGIETICPSINIDEMIKIATVQARVIVPLMSEAYEASNSAKYVLSYADEVGIPIVPVKAQTPYSASGWLGVICAGSLWTQMTNSDDFEQKLDELVGQLRPYMNSSSNEEQQQQQLDILADENLVQGYYIQNGQQCDMTFDMFTMVNGYIAGRGEDIVGEFVINGEYSRLVNSQEYQFQFTKHYIEQHDVQYAGTTTHSESQIFLDGNWSLEQLSDEFHLEVSLNKSSNCNKSHIMLSYQWNNQKLVKQIADLLKKNNIRIWFDIAGDMKGNINTAMANGVENAAIIVSFNTTAYSKSVNCQKELTYASQLKKTIVPVLLEDHTNFEDTWLGKIIISLEKIHMNDDKQVDATLKSLIEQIHEHLQQNENQEFNESEVITRFEGGAVRGKFTQYEKEFDMSFDFFSLRQGRVAGQGNDDVGHFVIAGTYDNDGNVYFIKQYIEQHAVEYEGYLKFDDMGNFEIKGKWRIGDATDDFFIESIEFSKSSTSSVTRL